MSYSPFLRAVGTLLLSTICLAGSRPDAHAPIGVMGDHLHARNQIMVSYRMMHMDMPGQRQGSQELSAHEVHALGHDAAATNMSMNMHMMGAMYAPTKSVTLMLMGMWLEKDMTLQSSPHGMHGHGTHGHSSSGWGDTSLTALIGLHQDDTHRVHLGLGVSLPTGAADVRQAGTFLPYGMQLGSGTWDFLPSVTYTGIADTWSWGAQISGKIREHARNDSGFTLGNAVSTTCWAARPLSESISASARLVHHSEGAIAGHFNDTHGHAAPPHFPRNYGGQRLECAAGLTLSPPTGPLAGHRIALEVHVPVYQDMNGIGMDTGITFMAGWQKKI